MGDLLVAIYGRLLRQNLNDYTVGSRRSGDRLVLTQESRRRLA
jgi:hypothetical protein